MTEIPPSPGPPPAAQRPRRSDLLKNILLSVVSTTIFLALLETGLRVFDLAPTENLLYPDEETWKALPGPFAPRQDFVDRSRPRLAHRIRINSLGFRGPEFPLTKETGTLRILCLGDSYVFGSYVNEGETFPSVLEARLRRKAPHRPIEVINGGVSGYTIPDEAALAEEKGFALEPDSILLSFVLNDLTEMTRRVSSRENQRREAREMSGSALTPVKALLRRTAIYNLLFGLKVSFMGRLKIDPTVQELPIRHLLHPPYDDATEALFARYQEELGRLAEGCRRRRIDLVLILFPFYEQVVEGAPAEAQARMSRMGAEIGIPVIDLLPAFREMGPRGADLFLMPLNHHPSALGYQVAAAEVASRLPLR